MEIKFPRFISSVPFFPLFLLLVIIAVLSALAYDLSVYLPIPSLIIFILYVSLLWFLLPSFWLQHNLAVAYLTRAGLRAPTEENHGYQTAIPGLFGRFGAKFAAILYIRSLVTTKIRSHAGLIMLDVFINLVLGVFYLIIYFYVRSVFIIYDTFRFQTGFDFITFSTGTLISAVPWYSWYTSAIRFAGRVILKR